LLHHATHGIPVSVLKNLGTTTQNAGLGDQEDMQVRPIPSIANEIGLKDDIHSATAQSAACVMDLSSLIGSTAR
jgi:hypothetical protein